VLLALSFTLTQQVLKQRCPNVLETKIASIPAHHAIDVAHVPLFNKLVIRIL
jgi:hypothetical protein